MQEILTKLQEHYGKAVDIEYTVNISETGEFAKKSDIARAIGEINRYFENQNKNILLVTPGRIGTSSPELGVPVVYAEISHFSAIMDFVRFSFRMLLTEIKVKSTQRRIYFVL